MSRALQAALEKHVVSVVGMLRRRAELGTFNGRPSPASMAYMDSCSVSDFRTGTRVIFTRDTGHHTSGWLKNPDYERCWHLSLSPLPPVIISPHARLAEPDRKTNALWVSAFFGPDVDKVWLESAKSPDGIRRNVTHWRLFCDEHWLPILPRKEVYSTEFTELGWKTASHVLFENGLHRSETEDGRIIESTVDPR